jgi:predicted MFS family arabinose efflux permease
MFGGLALANVLAVPLGTFIGIITPGDIHLAW